MNTHHMWHFHCICQILVSEESGRESLVVFASEQIPSFFAPEMCFIKVQYYTVEYK